MKPNLSNMLKGIVSSHKVIFVDDSLCHTLPEQQTQVVAPYKVSFQECHEKCILNI